MVPDVPNIDVSPVRQMKSWDTQNHLQKLVLEIGESRIEFNTTFLVYVCKYVTSKPDFTDICPLPSQGRVQKYNYSTLVCVLKITPSTFWSGYSFQFSFISVRY